MIEADLDLARRYLAAHPPPGEVLLCGVTGSHFYGFPSPDSDLDLKGLHLAPTESLLGLHPPKESHDRLEDFEAVEMDYTSHEAGRAIRLLLRGNGNLLERLLTPLQVILHPELEALQALARGSISRRFGGHYRGFFRGKREESARAGAELKAALYAYRVGLTGLHLFETGECVGDLRVLGPEHGFPATVELADRKGAGLEHDALDPADGERIAADLTRLEAALAAALEACTLPEEPPNTEAWSDWLVAVRRRQL